MPNPPERTVTIKCYFDKKEYPNTSECQKKEMDYQCLKCYFCSVSRNRIVESKSEYSLVSAINIIEEILEHNKISDKIRNKLMKAMYHLSWKLWKTHYIEVTCNECKWKKKMYSDEIPQDCPQCGGKGLGDYHVKSIFPTMVDPDGWGSLDDDGLWKYRNYKFNDV